MQPQYTPAPPMSRPAAGAGGGFAESAQAFSASMGATMQVMDLMRQKKKQKALDSIMDGAKDRDLTDRELMSISRLDPMVGKAMVEIQTGLVGLDAAQFKDASGRAGMVIDGAAQFATSLLSLDPGMREEAAVRYAEMLTAAGGAPEFKNALAGMFEDNDFSDAKLKSIIDAANYGLERLGIMEKREGHAAKTASAGARAAEADAGVERERVKQAGETARKQMEVDAEKAIQQLKNDENINLFEILQKAEELAEKNNVSVESAYAALTKDARLTWTDMDGVKHASTPAGQPISPYALSGAPNRVPPPGSPGALPGGANAGSTAGAPPAGAAPPTPAPPAPPTPASPAPNAPAQPPAPKTTAEAMGAAEQAPRVTPSIPARTTGLGDTATIPVKRRREILQALEGRHTDMGRKGRKRAFIVHDINSGKWDLVERGGQLYLQNISTLKMRPLGIKK